MNIALTAHAESTGEQAEAAVPAVEESPAAAQAGEATQEAAGAQQADTFAIKRFVVYGSTVFPPEKLKELLKDLRGENRTAADVEKARDTLERFYHDNGYPTTLVNIPEQSVEGGYVFLQVIEGKIGTVTVSGNGRTSTEEIMQNVPSLAPGEIAYLPAIQKELGKINGNPDLKVVPAMAPGKETGTVDVELKVEDKFPLHGNVEVSNRNSLNTSELRLNTMLRYDDLWGLRHSVSFQYQTAPQNTSEVKVFSGSYTLPAPWNDSDSLTLYGVRSDSETGFGEGFKTLGNGKIIGVRYLKPLAPYGKYLHNLTLGFDYKDFREAQTLSTEISYLPFSVAYSSSLADGTGTTQFNSGLNFVFRGLVTDREEFDAKRSNATGNYAVFTAGLERNQHLPAGMGLKVKVDGQVSDQPLISNEQYSAGGMESVRGYYESEASGDNAIHASVELSAPDLAGKVGLGEKMQFIPYIFYDYASLHVKMALPQQTANFTLEGAGAGVRGGVLGYVDYQVDGAFALRDAGSAPGNTQKGDSRVMFRVKAQF